MATHDQTPWTIRTATEADGTAVLALWLAAESVPSATDSEGGLVRLWDHDSNCLLVVEADGEIVGSLIAAWDGWRGSFYRLAVHPSRRRQGIATALIRAGEQRLRGLGAVRLTAIAASDEAAAMEFWSATGYELQESRSRFVRMTSG